MVQQRLARVALRNDKLEAAIIEQNEYIKHLSSFIDEKLGYIEQLELLVKERDAYIRTIELASRRKGSNRLTQMVRFFTAKVKASGPRLQGCDPGRVRPGRSLVRACPGRRQAAGISSGSGSRDSFPLRANSICTGTG